MRRPAPRPRSTNCCAIEGIAVNARTIDPVALAAELIRRPSVTPADAGAIAVLEAALGPLGFTCQRLSFAENGTAAIENLYAKAGSGGGKHFCFAGHTDV